MQQSALNKIVLVTLDWTSAPLLQCGETEIKFDGSDSGCMKCKLGYGDAFHGVRRNLPLARVWRQAVGWMEWNGIMFSSRYGSILR
jgi:hypothetical protein